jgi:hypothetical protein
VLLSICAACDEEAGGGTVNVSLREFSVSPDLKLIGAGTANFLAKNDGPAEPHEFVIVRTDLAPEALPMKTDGSFDPAGQGVQVLDEIDELQVGEEKSLSLDLPAGKYVLLCNRVKEEAGGIRAHYALGMHTAFTVDLNR